MTGKIVQYTFQATAPSSLATFYRDTLGTHVLRHEEYFEYFPGCQTEGVREQAWSKTVFGYWPENKSFTLEVHCKKDTGSTLKENQLAGITIKNAEIFVRAPALDQKVVKQGKKYVLTDPDGRRFFVEKHRKPQNKEPITKITLWSSSLHKTLDYWHCLLGMSIFSKKRRSVVLGYDDKRIKLKFKLAQKNITRGKNYLKISAPLSYMQKLETLLRENNQVISTPITTLHVNRLVDYKFMLVSDPDAHLICFVEENSFKAMAVTDERANILLNKFIDRYDRMETLKARSEETIAEETIAEDTIVEENI